MFCEPQPLDRVGQPAGEAVTPNAGKQRIALERMVHTPRRRDVHEFRQVTDTVRLHVLPRLESVDMHGARRWAEEAEQERDERALAGAIRAREAQDFSFAYTEREVREGRHFATKPVSIVRADVREFDHIDASVRLTDDGVVAHPAPRQPVHTTSRHHCPRARSNAVPRALGRAE